MANIDDVATGGSGRRLWIAGRPRPGCTESYVLLEEPTEPVMMHYRGRLVPHFRRDCPNCLPAAEGGDEPKPLWYVGAATVAGEAVILELTEKCFRSAASAANGVVADDVAAVGSFRGLVVRICRADWARSPRVLRCDQRYRGVPAWAYQTRAELARIWGVPTRPRLFRQEGA